MAVLSVCILVTKGTQCCASFGCPPRLTGINIFEGGPTLRVLALEAAAQALCAPKSAVMVTMLSSGPEAHTPQAMTTRPPSTAAREPWRPIGDAASTDGRRHVKVRRSSTRASFRKAPCGCNRHALQHGTQTMRNGREQISKR